MTTPRSHLLGLLVLASIGVARLAHASPADAVPATSPPPPPPALRLSVEIDPADYTIYDGWGGFVGIRPAATSPWRFRLGGGAATLPDAAVQNSDANDGWHQRIDGVVTLAAHRYFGHGRGGFFAGAVTGWSTITFTAPSGGTVDVDNVFAGIDLGYRWFPLRNAGLVITPHLGAIVPLYKSHEPTVDGMTYDLLPVIPMPQLLVGYEFDVLK
ncbi:MAG TPA: hypothetical protein VFQ53_35260 [Kofleriaceae bacterium]|nr:hypothetical protein [Kofleriaceae bacterium]